MCSHETMRETIVELRRQRDAAERYREVAEMNEKLAMEEVGNLQDVVIRLAAERDFLADRFLSADGWGQRDAGISSNALILWALKRCKWREVSGPVDRDDFARCVRAAERAPAHLKKRMRKGLERFERELEDEDE